ncbi:MAG: hypothetical protein OHK0045_25660 [Raineya sp.]
MKNKLKKIGVLALVLANFVIFAPQKVEGQGPVYEKKPGRTQCDGDLTICVCPEEVRTCECWIKVPTISIQ